MGVSERRRRERESRRELAIDAAMRIYEQEGYHSITMEKIAERSELSRSVLYLYFKNKEEIMVSAISAHADYFAQVLNDLYMNRERVKSHLLEKLWECFQKFYEKDPVTFTAWQFFHQSDVVGNLSEELRRSLHQAGAKAVALQHKIIEYAIDEGVFVDCDYRTLSEVIWSSFLGIIYIERSKRAFSRKNHQNATQDMARKILAQGVLKSNAEGASSLRQRASLQTDYSIGSIA
jgi:AcrR family transcriptional regulator